MNEKPDTVHGRLLEAVHISGYSFERACSEFEWLLEDNRWKQCSNGFESIDDFLSTINFSEFTIAIEKRKKLSKKLADMRATQRTIGGTLGVSQKTVYRDLEHDANASDNSKKQNINEGINELSFEVEKQVDAHASPDPPPPTITQSGAEVMAAANKIIEKGKNVHFSSESNEWTTPKTIVDRTIHLLGSIDLDPCSNSYITPNIPATKHYTIDDDGLSEFWHGRVYMNPPYGEEIGNWTEKLRTEYEEGRTTQGIALIPSRTDTEWFRGMDTFPRCNIWGRLKFSEYGNSAPFPSVVIYLGNNITGFIEIFCDIGSVFPCAYETRL